MHGRKAVLCLTRIVTTCTLFGSFQLKIEMYISFKNKNVFIVWISSNTELLCNHIMHISAFCYTHVNASLWLCTLGIYVSNLSLSLSLSFSLSLPLPPPPPPPPPPSLPLLLQYVIEGFTELEFGEPRLEDAPSTTQTSLV